MAKRGFYEDYQREKRERPTMIRKNTGTAVISFFAKLFAAILYLTATALSSVGLTTLINKPLRDLFFETATKLFLGN
ncbi:MAG: hypothetical protein LBK41_00395 [Clostridiales bacterium]|jgi:hypothetical protein|nr:hypothetical protein [Clostridiales bacterium]